MGSPGHGAPPWGQCWAEARPGCGPVGGGSMSGPTVQAQSWLWYSQSCGASGGQGVEGQVTAAPVGRRSPRSTVRSLSRGSKRKGQPGSTVFRLALSTGSQASRRRIISGPLSRCFCLEIKNKGNISWLLYQWLQCSVSYPSAESYSELSDSLFTASCFLPSPCLAVRL